jgi:hypothetical protein
MTFDDLLVQVLTLLQREQRLSYRALQRRLALEDADIEALKDEIIYAKRLAVDEDNRVLVWVGEAGTAPTAQSPQSTTTQASDQTAPPSSEAERRQLTILFCDSTRASAPQPVNCWHRSTAGSPRALTLPTSRTPRRSWRHYHNLTGTHGLGHAPVNTQILITRCPY